MAITRSMRSKQAILLVVFIVSMVLLNSAMNLNTAFRQSGLSQQENSEKMIRQKVKHSEKVGKKNPIKDSSIPNKEASFQKELAKRTRSEAQLMRECKSLPEQNDFGDSSAKMQPMTTGLLFHFLVLYDYLIPTYFCALESLLKGLESSSHHPIEIILWYSNEEAINSPKISNLINSFQSSSRSNQPTILKRFLNTTEAFAGTPLEGFYNCFDFYKLPLGQFAQQNVGNAVRLALLYKYGGFYLDLDFIVTKDISNFEDGFSSQLPGKFNNAALKFTTNGSRTFLKTMMKRFVSDYEDRWGNNGPEMLDRVIRTRSLCTYPGRTSSGLRNINGFKVECIYGTSNEKTSISIWPLKSVYPVAHPDRTKLYERATEANKESSGINGSSLVHLWHRHSAPVETDLCSNSWDVYSTTVIGDLRKNFCPSVFSTYENGNACFF